MWEGGLNAIFFSVYIHAHIMGPAAVQKALDQIDAIHENRSDPSAADTSTVVSNGGSNRNRGTTESLAEGSLQMK